VWGRCLWVIVKKSVPYGDSFNSLFPTNCDFKSHVLSRVARDPFVSIFKTHSIVKLISIACSWRCSSHALSRVTRELRVSIFKTHLSWRVSILKTHTFIGDSWLMCFDVLKAHSTVKSSSLGDKSHTLLSQVTYSPEWLSWLNESILYSLGDIQVPHSWYSSPTLVIFKSHTRDIQVPHSPEWLWWLNESISYSLGDIQVAHSPEWLVRHLCRYSSHTLSWVTRHSCASIFKTRSIVKLVNFVFTWRYSSPTLSRVTLMTLKSQQPSHTHGP